MVDREVEQQSPLPPSNPRTWEFDRYVHGRLKAEGIRIARAETFEQALIKATQLAQPHDVLVFTGEAHEGLGFNRLAQRDSAGSGGAVPRDGSLAQCVADQVVQNVCELPDYNSPEDQPDLLQCTVRELENCVLRAFESLSGEGPRAHETSDSVQKHMQANVRLTQRLADCELSLRAYDTGMTSEYWLRHPSSVKASPNLADAINCTCPYESRLTSLMIDPLCPVHSPTQNGPVESGKP